LNIIADTEAEAVQALQRAQQLFPTLTPNPVTEKRFEQVNLDIQVPTQSTTAPICGNHHISMKLIHGKIGDFYSCHEKMDDGSWCDYRP
jgi:hypothetical protein